MRLNNLFWSYRKPIALAGSLVIIESAAWIIEPKLFGNVIDVFIDKTLVYSDIEFFLPLLIWIGVYLLNSGVGSLRRTIDPRIFLKIFRLIALEVVKDGQKQGLPANQITARAELCREYVTFLQYRLPETITQTISIGGAMIATVFFDWRITLTCFLVIIPLIFVTRIYSRRVSGFQKDLHDTIEESIDIYTSEDIDRISDYYKRLTKHEQKIANWGAINFGLIRFSLLIIFLIVLYISIDIDNFSTGSIYAIVAYLWTFVTSIEYLPDLLESFTSINELSNRLKTENED